MVKSLSEMHKLMKIVLGYVKDDKFSISELHAHYDKEDIDEAIYACIENKLLTGINAARSAETNTILFYPGNIQLTYDGLVFLENN